MIRAGLLGGLTLLSSSISSNQNVGITNTMTSSANFGATVAFSVTPESEIELGALYTKLNGTSGYNTDVLTFVQEIATQGYHLSAMYRWRGLRIVSVGVGPAAIALVGDPTLTLYFPTGSGSGTASLTDLGLTHVNWGPEASMDLDIPLTDRFAAVLDYRFFFGLTDGSSRPNAESYARIFFIDAGIRYSL